MLQFSFAFNYGKQKFSLQSLSLGLIIYTIVVDMGLEYVFLLDDCHVEPELLQSDISLREIHSTG